MNSEDPRFEAHRRRFYGAHVDALVARSVCEFDHPEDCPPQAQVVMIDDLRIPDNVIWLFREPDGAA